MTYLDSTKKSLFFILSTTCPHCFKNLKKWNEIAENTDSLRCTVLGISTNDLERTRKYQDTVSLKFQLSAIADTSFFRKYKVSAYPETILIDSKGFVGGAWVGELSDEEIKEIQSLLNS